LTSNLFDYPNKLHKIIDKLKEKNLKPIIVGGYVRDFYLGVKSKDIDIEVYGLKNIDELILYLKEFGDIYEVGKSFGVAKLKFDDLELDFSLPRLENKVSKGHRGFKITTKKELDFKTASTRRDFTINAIGYDTLNNLILDPFKGLLDIKIKKLKIVDKNSFIEDPLRVFRAMSMVGRFELSIDSDTLKICKDMVRDNLLNELAKERIFKEFKKLFLNSNRPSLGIAFLKDIDINKFFNGFILKDSTLSSLDRFQTNKTDSDETNIKLLLVLLCYNMKDEHIDSFLNKLTNKKDFPNKIITIIKDSNLLRKKQDDYILKKLATTSKISELLLILGAQNFDTTYIYDKAKKLDILNLPIPRYIVGKDLVKLQIKPSPKYSKIIQEAYEMQLNSKFSTRDEALLWLRNFC